MQISATEAKNRFGYYLGQAEREPETLERSKSTEALKRELNETYRAWIAAQSALVERIGVFGEDLRPWQTQHAPMNSSLPSMQ
jgi:hypothetical protein